MNKLAVHERILLMQKWIAGKEIQYREVGGKHWITLTGDDIAWNGEGDYRERPAPREFDAIVVLHPTAGKVLYPSLPEYEYLGQKIRVREIID